MWVLQESILFHINISVRLEMFHALCMFPLCLYNKQAHHSFVRTIL